MIKVYDWKRYINGALNISLLSIFIEKIELYYIYKDIKSDF